MQPQFYDDKNEYFHVYFYPTLTPTYNLGLKSEADNDFKCDRIRTGIENNFWSEGPYTLSFSVIAAMELAIMLSLKTMEMCCTIAFGLGWCEWTIMPY